MRDIQARRRRKIVGPTSVGRDRAVSDDAARSRVDPNQVDVWGWENEGGARRLDPAADCPTSRLPRQG
jgi:hypothetical protein